MRILFSTTALVLFLGFAGSASAMCGGGQAGASSAGMCGPMNTGQAVGQTQGSPEANKPQQQAGMCGCCRNMAMMRRGQQGDSGGMNMPGMEMPKPQ